MAWPCMAVSEIDSQIFIDDATHNVSCRMNSESQKSNQLTEKCIQSNWRKVYHPARAKAHCQHNKTLN